MASYCSYLQMISNVNNIGFQYIQLLHWVIFWSVLAQAFSSLKFTMVLFCKPLSVDICQQWSVFQSWLYMYMYLQIQYLLLASTCNLNIRNINITKILRIGSALHTFLLYLCYHNTVLNSCQACKNPLVSLVSLCTCLYNGILHHVTWLFWRCYGFSMNPNLSFVICWVLYQEVIVYRCTGQVNVKCPYA